MTVNTQKKLVGAEIYVNDDKELFEKYRAQKEAIEIELGRELHWRTATKDCRILALNSGDISKGKNTWNNQFDWYCEMAIKLRGIIKKYEV